MTKNVEYAYNTISNSIKNKEKKIMIHKLRYVLKGNRCYCESQISKQRLEKMRKEGALLLDVRSPQEFEEGHLENAISLPEYEIKEKADNILPDKSKSIIVYCSTGHRSQKAQKLLKKMGYQKVYNLCSGIENYAGLNHEIF